MAIWYANSITGSNGNSGATEALAKATLAGAVGVASSGDEIRCTGTFLGVANPNTAKVVTYKGWPHAIFDGNNAVNYFGSSNTAGWLFQDITFRQFSIGAFGRGALDGGTFFRCVFRDMPHGLSSYHGAPCNFSQCLFTNLSVGGICGIPTWATHIITAVGNVFAGNAASVKQTLNETIYYGGGGSYIRNIFADPVMFDLQSSLNYPYVSAFNLFDFTNGTCIRNGSTITSLAAWQSSIGGGRDSSSVDRVPVFADSTAKVWRHSPGAVEKIGSLVLGIEQPTAIISNNVNASLWTGGTFSNTEIDGSGNLVLSAGQTLGTWTSGELDLGAAIALRSISLSVNNETSSTFVDSSIADSPGYLTVELRGSNTSPVSGSYTAVPRLAEIGAYMTSTYRYWQIKLTLRA